MKKYISHLSALKIWNFPLAHLYFEQESRCCKIFIAERANYNFSFSVFFRSYTHFFIFFLYFSVFKSFSMRRLLSFLTVTICSILLSFPSYAQPCATLQVIGPPGGTIPCDSALNLTALITFPTGINNTTTYIGDTIPFNPAPFVGPNPILVAIDDIWSGVVPLPFPFCYFGNTYTDMIVSSNGQICFDQSQAELYNSWA